MKHCPEGHPTTAEDYCDICGVPMTAAPAPAEEPSLPAPATPPTDTAAGATSPATQACPHCAAVNSEANLFCEVCGFDFTTGVMPRVEGGAPSYLPPVTPVAVPTPAVEATPPADPSPTADPDPAPALAPTAGPTPAEAAVEHDNVLDLPDLDDAAPAPAAPAENRPTVDAGVDSADGNAPLPSPRAAEAAGMPTPPSAAETRRPDEPETEADPVRSGPKPVNRPPSRVVAGDWVVEVWIDPDWYAVQESAEECPSVAPPEIVRITGSDALIGRRSRSSVPDVDCGMDSAVSRKQALLTSDGRRWWVEDLDSSNGTWVGPAIGPLPTDPITTKTEIDADDRVYVGAWTRIVLRPATASETADL